MLTSRRMFFFIPQMIWTGCSEAYYQGLLIPIMSWQELANEDQHAEETAKERLSNALFAMILFGVG